MGANSLQEPSGTEGRTMTHESTSSNESSGQHKGRCSFGVTSVIHPQSRRKIKWDVFVSILIVYSVLIIPYRIGFDVEARGFAYGFDWFVDGMFFLDMVLSFRTAYYSGDELIVNNSMIVRTYLRSWFAIDLVSTLPIDLMLGPLLMSGSEAGDSNSLKSIKLIKFFRLIRLVKLVRLLKLKKFGSSLEGTFSMNPALQRLLKLLLQIIFICHLLASFWFYTSQLSESDQTWAIHHGIVDESVSTKYLASFYWTVATMMAVGYGDVYAVNDSERMYSIMVQVIGATCFGFIIANISAFMETFDPRASAYRSRMDSLSQYMRERDLPKKLQKRVRKFYDFKLSKESIFDDSKILSQLPVGLMETLIMHVHGETASRITCLKDEDTGFVTYIMASTSVVMALSGEVVCEQDSVASSMYFLCGGNIETIFLENDATAKQGCRTPKAKAAGAEEPMVDTGSLIFTKDKAAAASALSAKRRRSSLSKKNTPPAMIPIGPQNIKRVVVTGWYEPGSHFGDIALLHCEPHMVTYRASRTCDLLSVNKSVLDYATYLYPASMLRLRQRSEKHKALMKKSLKAPCTKCESSGRLYKTLLTSNASEHVPASAIMETRPPFTISPLIAHDALGRFKGSQSKIEEVTVSPKLEKKKRASTTTFSLLSSLGSEGQSTTGDTSEERPTAHSALETITVRLRPTTAARIRVGRDRHAKEGVLYGQQQKRHSRRQQQSKVSPVLDTATDRSPILRGDIDSECETVTSLNEPPTPKIIKSKRKSSIRLNDGAVFGERGALVEVDVKPGILIKRLWVIPPDFGVKIKWDIMMAFYIVYSVLVVPYRIGFSQTTTGFATIFDWVVDIFFMLDMVLAFWTAFEDPMDDVLVAEPALIRKHYLRGWFTVDFLSTFPFDTVITTFLKSANPEALRSFKLIKVFRMVRLLKLFRLFKLQKIFANIEFDIGPGPKKLSKLLFQISFVAHLFACFWFYASSSSSDQRAVWYIKMGLSPDPDQDVGSKYMSSLYWSFTTMTTVGYGDIAPTTNEERIFSIIIMILGATIFGYVVGSIASLIAQLDLADALFKSRMSELDEYLTEQGIPKQLRKECKSCYAFSLSLSSVFDEKALLSGLSPSLRHEILIFVHAQAVDRIPLFDNETATFIGDLLMKMEPQLALPDVPVVSYNELGTMIYFVVNGQVAAIEGQEWPQQASQFEGVDPGKVTFYSQGMFFGHEAVLSGTNHKMSARAVRTSEFYILSKRNIGILVDDNPAFARKLQASLERAIHAQDDSIGKPKPKNLWKVVQNRFMDILSFSPSKMRSIGAEAQNVTTFQSLMDELMNNKKLAKRATLTSLSSIRALTMSEQQSTTFSASDPAMSAITSDESTFSAGDPQFSAQSYIHEDIEEIENLELYTKK